MQAPSNFAPDPAHQCLKRKCDTAGNVSATSHSTEKERREKVAVRQSPTFSLSVSGGAGKALALCFSSSRSRFRAQKESSSNSSCAILAVCDGRPGIKLCTILTGLHEWREETLFESHRADSATVGATLRLPGRYLSDRATSTACVQICRKPDRAARIDGDRRPSNPYTIARNMPSICSKWCILSASTCDEFRPCRRRA